MMKHSLCGVEICFTLQELLIAFKITDEEKESYDQQTVFISAKTCPLAAQPGAVLG